MNSSASTPQNHFATFAEFYPYYLTEHSHPVCRRLHFVGTALVIACLVVALVSRNAWWLTGMPIAGYSFAWLGHFMFEKNRPATFAHPLYSLLADFVLFRDMLIGRIRF
ncbi:MAG TPA: Mpo1-like protein [Povalibacter sp.]|nr:Mpo1-like protein [Povalibacter sp.]